MKKIRRGMFETNSSSTHTIIITDEPCEPALKVDFRIGEFGWECDTYYDIDTKASYIYTLACACLGRDVYQDFCDILCKYGVDCECSAPARICVSKYKDEEYTYLDNGYVDHDYEGRDLVDAIFEDESRLIRFLFSPDSFVVTCNDNMEEDEIEEWEDAVEVSYPHETYYKGN